jgi:hypothetical protein
LSVLLWLWLWLWLVLDFHFANPWERHPLVHCSSSGLWPEHASHRDKTSVPGLIMWLCCQVKTAAWWWWFVVKSFNWQTPYGIGGPAWDSNLAYDPVCRHDFLVDYVLRLFVRGGSRFGCGIRGARGWFISTAQSLAVRFAWRLRTRAHGAAQGRRRVEVGHHLPRVTVIPWTRHDSPHVAVALRRHCGSFHRGLRGGLVGLIYIENRNNASVTVLTSHRQTHTVRKANTKREFFQKSVSRNSILLFPMCMGLHCI